VAPALRDKGDADEVSEPPTRLIDACDEKLGERDEDTDAEGDRVAAEESDDVRDVSDEGESRADAEYECELDGEEETVRAATVGVMAATEGDDSPPDCDNAADELGIAVGEDVPTAFVTDAVSVLRTGDAVAGAPDPVRQLDAWGEVLMRGESLENEEIDAPELVERVGTGERDAEGDEESEGEVWAVFERVAVETVDSDFVAVCGDEREEVDEIDTIDEAEVEKLNVPLAVGEPVRSTVALADTVGFPDTVSAEDTEDERAAVADGWVEKETNGEEVTAPLAEIKIESVVAADAEAILGEGWRESVAVPLNSVDIDATALVLAMTVCVG
jgi:hypothetical protein